MLLSNIYLLDGPKLNSSELAAMRSDLVECEQSSELHKFHLIILITNYSNNFLKNVNSKWFSSSVDNCYKTGDLTDCVLAEGLCESGDFHSHFVNTGLNVYDIRTPYTTKDTFPPNYYKFYLARPEIRTAIGAFKNYTDCIHDTYISFFLQGDM